MHHPPALGGVFIANIVIAEVLALNSMVVAAVAKSDPLKMDAPVRHIAFQMERWDAKHMQAAIGRCHIFAEALELGPATENGRSRFFASALKHSIRHEQVHPARRVA